MERTDRKQIEELTALRYAPVPNPDLRRDLSAPTVRGIGAGETLKIVWPGATRTASGPDERSCEPLAMFAMLFPERLADAAMAEAERMANDPIPIAQRPAHIGTVTIASARGLHRMHTIARQPAYSLRCP